MKKDNQEENFHEESSLLGKKDAATTNNEDTAKNTLPTIGSDEHLEFSCDEEEQQPTLLGGLMVVFENSTYLSPNEHQEGGAEDATLIEGVVEEVNEVAEVILEELQEADDGDMFYLEMSLTRNLSILPGDLVDAAIQLPTPFQVPTTDDLELQQQPQMMKEEATTRPPFSAYLMLLIAIISLSSIGPLLQLQQDVSPTMKILWRMAGTAILLLPLAARDIYRKGFPKLTTPQWITFLLSTASYDVMTVAFVQALSYTAVGNAVILANSLALILLIGKLCVGSPITFLEGAGALIAFGGAALCSKDSAETSSGVSPSSDSLWGDALAILSASGGVGYLIFAKTSRPNMPLYVFMFLTMSVGCAMILVFQILVLKENVSFDRNPNHGIWGFLVVTDHLDRLPLEVVMVVVCNLLGTMGYVRAMQYFDNLVISSAALLEPVIAEFLAFSFGVGSLPGWQGWLGNVLVALGTFAVVFQVGNKDGKSVH